MSCKHITLKITQCAIVTRENCSLCQLENNNSRLKPTNKQSSKQTQAIENYKRYLTFVFSSLHRIFFHGTILAFIIRICGQRRLASLASTHSDQGLSSFCIDSIYGVFGCSAQYVLFLSYLFLSYLFSRFENCGSKAIFLLWFSVAFFSCQN